MKPTSSWITLFLLTISFITVGFGQPFLVPFFSFFATTIGYALFWKALLHFKSSTQRFWLATIWFGLVQSVHLSWLTSDHYVGAFIFLVYIFLVLWFGIEFGLLSLFVKKKPSILRILGIAGGWVLLEWSRLFVLTGFSWSSVGLALSTSDYSLQLSSIAGIFGLTFWVILTNLLALRFFENWKDKIAGTFWIAACVLPYGFGAWQIFNERPSHHNTIEAVLIQTALSPEEKVSLSGSHFKTLHPVEQWRLILNLLKEYQDQEIDLIVLPEAVVPYGTDLPLYNPKVVAETFQAVFEQKDHSYLPLSEKEVGNAFWAQGISNFFNSEVIIGLEDFNHQSQASYNAAFFVQPQNNKIERYEKRVLVPGGEYIPFEWCKSILAKYGITDSFTPGGKAKVFDAKKIPIGISICYEETYGNLMRQNRQQGAGLLVNITNDVWYPLSKLPMIHFYHGRLRAVENGIPVLRACNTGLTCCVDSHGRLLQFLEPETSYKKAKSGTLKVNVPLNQFETVYSKLGDNLIVITSILFLFISFFYKDN